MKTRIISGMVIIAVVIGVLYAGQYLPVIITAFLALLCAGAIYELLYKTKLNTEKISVTAALVYGVVTVFANSEFLTEKVILPASVAYGILVAVLSVFRHSEFKLKEITASLSFPFVTAFVFSSLEKTVNRAEGIYYVVLLLMFSAVCDTGAYFTGVTIGKHKLCPEISPKKTVEGSVGGIVLMLVGVLVCVFAFSKTDRLLPTLLVSIPLSVLGMCGDLFASVIKRNVGIKDFSNLIPGHGGIMDRLDSILFIAPVLYLCIDGGII